VFQNNMKRRVETRAGFGIRSTTADLQLLPHQIHRFAETEVTEVDLVQSQRAVLSDDNPTVVVVVAVVVWFNSVCFTTLVATMTTRPRRGYVVTHAISRRMPLRPAVIRSCRSCRSSLDRLRTRSMSSDELLL